jgi:starvation-inducible DNA-binding protein
MNLESQLEQVFATNFTSYYRAHVAHVNVTGRNFVSDHKILGKIYEDLQGNIDRLAEILRTLRAFMPANLDTVIELSVNNTAKVKGDAEELLQMVYDDQEVLIDEYIALIEVADEEGHSEIANYAQDRLAVHRKNCWMLRSILEEREEDEDEEDYDD